MFSKPQFTEKEIADLQEAYQDAVYKVYYDHETIQLSIGQYNRRLDLVLEKYECTTWALMTAFNPYSQCLSAIENQQRHQDLFELVRSLGLIMFDAVGKDKDGVWTPEKSLFILNIERDQAIAIGQKLQQNAIVFGELKDAPRLVWL